MKAPSSRPATGLLEHPITFWTWIGCLLVPPAVAAQVTITVDAATRFQTMSGWECVVFASQDDPAFPNFQDELFDRVINEAGINRIRLELRSGAENSTDYYGQYQSGQVDYDTWRANRYGGVSDANLQALASRAQQHGKRTSMLEWWSTGNSIDVLLKDLAMGMNAAWQKGVLGGVGGLDDNMALYKVDVTNPSTPVVLVNRKTRLLRQVYRFVRRGAVRVAAASSSATLQPLAFINADGSQVVVVRASDGSFQLTIRSLKPGFRGVVERSMDLALPDGWREEALTVPSDFISSWPGSIDASQAFFRFRQM